MTQSTTASLGVSTTSSGDGPDAADRWLRHGALVFAIVVLFHNADHLRRGLDVVPGDVQIAGTLAIVVEVGVVVVAFSGHRLAPLVAVSAGYGLAVGFFVVHVLPGRGWLSDPLFDGVGQGLSQAAALAEIVGGLVVGTAGVAALRRRGGLAGATVARPVQPMAAVLAHPVVAVMVAGNLVIVAAGYWP